MSDYQDQEFTVTECSGASKLYLCLFSNQQLFTQSLIKLLTNAHYKIKTFYLTQEFVDFLTNNKEQIDCIVLVKNAQSNLILAQLWQSQILLPIVIVEVEQLTYLVDDAEQNSPNSLIPVSNQPLYHRAEIHLYPTQLAEINSYINLAINKFLNLTPNSDVQSHHKNKKSELEEGRNNYLILQQRRLIEKLKERLGYLGVYYKRNPSDFYRNLSSKEQDKIYQQLSQSYRKIILNYFTNNSTMNSLIDEFVDQVFFADISTSQILEIHMELIDEFAHQLQIEGRSDDILLDYRLVLIDIMAHLCEMYRRSIPGDDLSLELLFRVE